MDISIKVPRFSLSGLLTPVTSAALIAAMLAPAAALAEIDTQISLRLDYDLVPQVGTPGLNREALGRSSRPPELQSRVLKVQDQVDALVRKNEEKVKLLEERQRMISSIRGVVSAQDQMIGVLKTEIARPAPVADPPPVAPPAPPPAPAPAVAMPAPVAAVPSASAPLQIGPVQIPAWLQPWLVEGALGIVIVVLLGLTLHSRAAARAKEQELAALTSGVGLVPAPAEPAPPTEMPEPASPTEMPEPAQPSAPRTPRHTEPEPAALPPISPEAASLTPEKDMPESRIAAAAGTEPAGGDTTPGEHTMFVADVFKEDASQTIAGTEPDGGTQTDDGTRPEDAPEAEAAGQAEPTSDKETQDSAFDPDDVDFLFEVFGEDEESLEKTRDQSADKS